MDKITNRKVVVLNQAVNYLTVDLCNAFYKRFTTVALVTGNIHEQERVLDKNIEVSYITKWVASPLKKKLISNLKASAEMFWLLKTKYKEYEVFFISVPPMGYLINLIVPNRFSMLIWDVFPDALMSMGVKKNSFIFRSWSYLNKKSFKKAYQFYTISETMSELLEQYVSKEKQLITPIWSVFQNKKKIKKSNNLFIKQNNLDDKFIVQYSGNIARSHKVEYLLQIAEMLLKNDKIYFQIIGKGPRVSFLNKLIKEKKLTNCDILSFQSDDMFPYSLSAANLGVVILDSVSGKGSVPSKSYNLMSLGIPSLYISSKDSELYNYIQKYSNGKWIDKTMLKEAADFINELSQNKEMQKKYSFNAHKAASDFKLDNADRVIELYLKE